MSSCARNILTTEGPIAHVLPFLGLAESLFQAADFECRRRRPKTSLKSAGYSPNCGTENLLVYGSNTTSTPVTIFVFARHSACKKNEERPLVLRMDALMCASRSRSPAKSSVLRQCR